MTSTIMPQEEGHSDDIIGISEYAPVLPQKKDFLPWHKPRKQFVRQKQWCEQINKLVDEIMPENNVLKYLGLPGDDLLDLRYIHRIVCQPKNLRLRFLGFNHGINSSTHGAELNISLDEVNKLPLVDPSSDIIGDNICQIANTESLAWERSRKMGPYDVINIDLCDGFGKHPHDKFKETHYNTVSQLMALQARRANPWLLLLTTRTGIQHTDPNIFELLKSLYGQNLANCPEFLNASNNNFLINDNQSLEKISSSSKGVSDVFLIAICKWIASIAVAQVPPSKVEIKSVIGYNVDPKAGHQDLVSLAIKIEPTLLAASDKLGLSSQQSTAPNECNIAVQALNKVANIRDADAILTSNEEIMREMIATTEILLEEARYDISAYSEWARTLQ